MPESALMPEFLVVILWVAAALAVISIVGFVTYRYAKQKAEILKESELRAAGRFEAAMTKTFEQGKLEVVNPNPAGAPSAPAGPPVSGASAPFSSPSASLTETTFPSPAAAEPFGSQQPAMPAQPSQVDAPGVESALAPPAGLAASGGGRTAKIDEAIRKLETAGLLERVEDSLVLTEDLPPAQLVALKGGKRALILPPYTPFDLMDRHRNEADYLIHFPGSGAPLVSRDIQDYIADSLFDT